MLAMGKFSARPVVQHRLERRQIAPAGRPASNALASEGRLVRACQKFPDHLSRSPPARWSTWNRSSRPPGLTTAAALRSIVTWAASKPRQILFAPAPADVRIAAHRAEARARRVDEDHVERNRGTAARFEVRPEATARFARRSASTVSRSNCMRAPRTSAATT